MPACELQQSSERLLQRTEEVMQHQAHMIKSLLQTADITIFPFPVTIGSLIKLLSNDQ